MELVDQAVIHVRSGRGGDGCVSFRREKNVPRGGPDGGDGGRGGDVVLVGDPHLDSLLPLASRPHRRAGNGVPGAGHSRHGADGAPCEVPVPLGSIVRDDMTGTLVADIEQVGQRVVVAEGGRGGFGNEHFKSSVNQAPRECTPGVPGEEHTLNLELKLIADAGLVGLPNAGKSTLLRALSAARPKVAAYPFTTLSPHLGIAALPGDRRLVLADIPGLIEGAAEGAGMGHAFLRHVERTKVLVHLVDLAPMDATESGDAWRTVRAELGEHGAGLADKPELVVGTKIDLVPPGERAAHRAALAEAVGVAPQAVHLVSGVTGEGTGDLLEACWRMVGEPREGWAATGAT